MGGGLRRMGGGGGGGPSSGIVCEIVNWKLIGEGGRELADFGLVTIIFTYSPHRIIRILQSPMGVHKEKRDYEKILHRSPPTAPLPSPPPPALNYDWSLTTQQSFSQSKHIFFFCS